ncbi:MAG: NUDIX domain-containing protein, partial [Rhizobiales bacterium]|nr:NUDIX domain-containing protein [Hyphomicrobiales bacterium]
MASSSAGILMYQSSGNNIAVLLVHPGGPYWSKRDFGAWSIPKGEIDDGEATENAARREFAEELGVSTDGPLQPLGTIRQRAGKIVYGYALEGHLDIRAIRSNHTTIAW